MRRIDNSIEARKKYIAEIQELYKKLGRPPKKSEYKYANRAAIIWGGSWRTVLQEAGCQGENASLMTDEELYEKYLEKKQALGRKPTSLEFAPYYQVIYKRHGSWKNWLKEIGEVPTCSDEYLINILREFYEKNGRSPKCKEVPYYSLIREKLGDGRWSAALQKAGLPVDQSSRHTNAELIQKIKSKAEELGRAPAARELPESITVIRRFGSWKNGLALAGLKPTKKIYNRQKHIPDSEILMEIQILMLQKGRDPYYREYQHAGLCVKRFGKWNSAVEAAKKDPYHTMDTAKNKVLSSNT